MSLDLLSGPEVDERIGLYVANKIAIATREKPRNRASDVFGLYRAVAVVSDTEFLAGIVWYNYRPDYKTIEVAIAAENGRWCAKGVLKDIFSYPFLQMNCRRISAVIARNNRPAIKLCKGLGFVHEGTHRKMLGRNDGFSFGLLKENCKWIKEKSSEPAVPPSAIPVPTKESANNGQAQSTLST